jgi:hypothetical protein
MKNKMIFIALTIFIQCKENVEYIGECNIPPHVSYAIHVYPIITKACAIPQCHTRDFDYGNFNRFEDIKERADNGKLKFLIETHQMPHGFTEGPLYLTSCEIETIKEWIREGANNN